MVPNIHQVITHTSLQRPFSTMMFPCIPWQKLVWILWIVVVKGTFTLCFLFQMSPTSTIVAIGCLTELFILAGTPPEVFANNGQPFNSKEWYNLTDKYGFKHTMSSPHCPHFEKLHQEKCSHHEKCPQQG